MHVVQLYEKRIENAYAARDRCADEWGYNYWNKVAGELLRNLNKILHEKGQNNVNVIHNYH